LKPNDVCLSSGPVLLSIGLNIGTLLHTLTCLKTAAQGGRNLKVV